MSEWVDFIRKEVSHVDFDALTRQIEAGIQKESRRYSKPTKTNDFFGNYLPSDIRYMRLSKKVAKIIKTKSNCAYVYDYDADGNIRKITDVTSHVTTYCTERDGIRLMFTLDEHAELRGVTCIEYTADGYLSTVVYTLWEFNPQICSEVDIDRYDHHCKQLYNCITADFVRDREHNDGRYWVVAYKHMILYKDHEIADFDIPFKEAFAPGETPTI